MSDMLIHKSGLDDGGKFARELGKIKASECDAGVADCRKTVSLYPAANEFTVVHGLGKVPAFSFRDSAGTPWTPQYWQPIDLDTMYFYFKTAFAGDVYFN